MMRVPRQKIIWAIVLTCFLFLAVVMAVVFSYASVHNQNPAVETSGLQHMTGVDLFIRLWPVFTTIGGVIAVLIGTMAVYKFKVDSSIVAIGDLKELLKTQLYSQDGESIYMPRGACRQQRDDCVEHRKEDIERIEKTLEKMDEKIDRLIERNI